MVVGVLVVVVIVVAVVVVKVIVVVTLDVSVYIHSYVHSYNIMWKHLMWLCHEEIALGKQQQQTLADTCKYLKQVLCQI